MKINNIIRKYGRDITSRMRECADETGMKKILEEGGFTVSDVDVKQIAALLRTMSGELRDLTLDELNQITGGTSL